MSINLLGDISIGPCDNDHSIGDWDMPQPLRSQPTPAPPATTSSTLLSIFESPPKIASTNVAPRVTEPGSPLLIDFATASPPRAAWPQAYQNSLPRRSSPLKQALAESTTSTIHGSAALMEGVPVFRETPPSPELSLAHSTRSPLSKQLGRKWARVHSSPKRDIFRELSPIKHEVGDESCVSFGLGANFEQSLLVDERGSFIVDASADFTIDQPASGLSAVNEEEEAPAQGEAILPASLTGSTSHPRSQSLVQGKTDSYRSLLVSSTASYRDHRDSPAKPRVVSIQAEQAAEVATPRRKLFAHIEDSPECLSNASGSSADRAASPDTTNLFDLSPPAELLRNEERAANDTTFDSPVLPRVNVHLSPVEPEPDSPSIARILKSDLLGIGSESVDLMAGGADMSVANLLAVAAPEMMDLSAWGDESIMFPSLSSRPTLQPSLVPVSEELNISTTSLVSQGEAAVGTLIELATPPRQPTKSTSTAPLKTSTATPGKTPLAISGTERLRQKMAELAKRRAQDGAAPAKVEQTLSLLDDRPLQSTSAPPPAPKASQPRQSLASPEKRRLSTAPPASASRPRTLPASSSARRLSTLGATPATPGRSESTRERLDRAKEERLRREAERSPEKRSTAPVPVARPALARSNSSTSALAGRAGVAPSRALPTLSLAGPKPRAALGPGNRLSAQTARPALAAPSTGSTMLARASSLKSRVSISGASTTPAKSKIASPIMARASIASGSAIGLGSAAGVGRPLGSRPNGR